MRITKIALIVILIALFLPYAALAKGRHSQQDNNSYNNYGNYGSSYHSDGYGYRRPIVANSPSMPFNSGFVNYNPFAPGRQFFQPSNPFPRENFYNNRYQPYYGY